MVEENERLVAKEVAEQPTNEDEEKYDDRNRVPEQAEENDYEHHQGVINTKVVDVLADSGHGVVIAERERKGGEIEELSPWPPCGD